MSDHTSNALSDIAIEESSTNPTPPPPGMDALQLEDSKGGYGFVKKGRGKRKPAKKVEPAPSPAVIDAFFADMEAKVPTRELPDDYVAPMLVPAKPEPQPEPVLANSKRTIRFSGALIARLPAIVAEAVAPSEPVETTEFDDDVLTVEVPAPDLPIEMTAEPPPAQAVTKYHDPDLCSCERMRQALADKVVDVIYEGPVTLPPAVMTEEAMMSGRWDASNVERAYDGKPWALMYCPFEDRPLHLIDDQVEIPQVLNDGCHCCTTMRLAEMHGRVELPRTEENWQLPMFVRSGHAGMSFLTCPWCGTSTIDLIIAREKRQISSRNP